MQMRHNFAPVAGPARRGPKGPATKKAKRRRQLVRENQAALEQRTRRDPDEHRKAFAEDRGQPGLLSAERGPRRAERTKDRW